MILPKNMEINIETDCEYNKKLIFTRSDRYFFNDINLIKLNTLFINLIYIYIYV